MIHDYYYDSKNYYDDGYSFYSEIIYNQLMYAERQRQKRNTSIVLNYNFGKQQKVS